jgi:phosphatidate phosphatase PAH1
MRALVLSALPALLLAACTGPSADKADTGAGPTGDDTAGTGCPAVTADTRAALVTDIDETLTTDDDEFLAQIADPTHDPAMRPDASALMTGYHALGYRIFYVTARGDDLSLVDGTSAYDATSAWLDAHGFPVFDPADIFLADGLGAFGDSAAEYKTGVVQDLIAGGFVMDYAYGNADSDVAAYQASAIADDHDFLVGDLAVDAATYGVVGILNEDAYTNHLASWLPSVPCSE